MSEKIYNLSISGSVVEKRLNDAARIPEIEETLNQKVADSLSTLTNLVGGKQPLITDTDTINPKSVDTTSAPGGNIYTQRVDIVDTSGSIGIIQKGGATGYDWIRTDSAHTLQDALNTKASSSSLTSKADKDNSTQSITASKITLANTLNVGDNVKLIGTGSVKIGNNTCIEDEYMEIGNTIISHEGITCDSGSSTESAIVTNGDIEATVNNVDHKLSNKADKATTLEGYGITTRYATYDELQRALSSIFIIKGEADVAWVNSIVSPQIGSLYIMTDSGTVRHGASSVTVRKGDVIVFTEDNKWSVFNAVVDMSSKADKNGNSNEDFNAKNITASSYNGDTLSVRNISANNINATGEIKLETGGGQYVHKLSEKANTSDNTQNIFARSFNTDSVTVADTGIFNTSGLEINDAHISFDGVEIAGGDVVVFKDGVEHKLSDKMNVTDDSQDILAKSFNTGMVSVLDSEVTVCNVSVMDESGFHVGDTHIYDGEVKTVKNGKEHFLTNKVDTSTLSKYANKEAANYFKSTLTVGLDGDGVAIYPDKRIVLNDGVNSLHLSTTDIQFKVANNVVKSFDTKADLRNSNQEISARAFNAGIYSFWSDKGFFIDNEEVITRNGITFGNSSITDNEVSTEKDGVTHKLSEKMNTGGDRDQDFAAKDIIATGVFAHNITLSETDDWSGLKNNFGENLQDALDAKVDKNNASQSLTVGTITIGNTTLTEAQLQALLAKL